MNRIYKVIWSRVKHCYVVVSEITKSAGKGISAVSGHSLCALVCALALTGCLVPGMAEASFNAGTGSSAYSADSIAVGDDAQTTKQYTVALGSRTRATEIYAIAMGDQAKATGQGATAIGSLSLSTALHSLAVGDQAHATGQDSSAYGLLSDATGVGSVALGTVAKAHSNNAIAVGNTSTVTGLNSIGIGSLANAAGSQTVVVGRQAHSDATSENSVAIGQGAHAAGQKRANDTYSASTIAIGNVAEAAENGDIVIGRQAVSTVSEYHNQEGSGAVVMGAEAKSYGSRGDVVLGSGAEANIIRKGTTNPADTPGYSQSIAIGSMAKVYGTQAMAIGGDALSIGHSSIAIGGNDIDQVKSQLQAAVPDLLAAGVQNKFTRETAALYPGTTLGSAALSTSQNYSNTASIGGASIAMGAMTQSFGVGSTAIGVNSLSKGIASTGIGVMARSWGKNSLAIGSQAGAYGDKSTSVGDTNKVGFDMTDGTISGASSAAVGTDNNIYGNNSYAVGSGNTVGSATVTDTTEANGDKIKKVTAGTVKGNAAGAFGYKNSITADNAYAMGNNSTASAAGAMVLGNSASVTAENGVALGNNTKVTNAGAVAIGAGSETAVSVATPSATINGTTHAFAGTNPAATVSVGKAGGERTITNVAAGRISAASTDAINGSQLYAVTSEMDKGVAYAGDVKGAGAADNKFTRKLGEQTNIIGGVADASKLSDGNIGVVSNGTDTLTVKLAKDVKVDSVTTGNTVINNNGLTVGGKTYVTNNGINANNTVITNVASGGNTTTNAANIGDVQKAAAGAKSAVTGAKQATVTGTVAADGHTDYVVSATKTTLAAATGGKISVTGGTEDANGVIAYTVGLDAATKTAIDNIGGGTISAGDTKTVTGDTVNTYLNNNYYNKTTMDSKLDDKANTNLDNITNAGKTVINDIAADSVKVINGKNTTVTSGTEAGANGTIKTYAVNVSGDLTGITSISNQKTAPDGTITGTKITFGDTTNTVNVGGAKITNVAAGDISANSTDAINGSQLYAVTSEVDKGVAYAGDVKAAAAAANKFTRKLGEQTNIVGGVTDTSKLTDNNIGVVSNGTDTLTVKLAKTLTGLDSVTAGNTTINNNGLAVGGKTYVTNNGINANNQKVTNVADGNVASGSKDAVNGGQLHDAKNEVINKGLRFDADNNSEKTNKLGSKVTVNGDSNITTEITQTGDDTKIGVKLNRDINVKTVTATDTVKAGGVTMGNQTSGGTNGNYVTGLDNKDWNIQNPNIVSGRGATEDQLKIVSDEVKKQGANATDYRLVQNASSVDGSYTVDANGDIDLTVEDKNHAGQKETVTIKDVASKSKLDDVINKGLQFDANTGGVQTNKLGSKITVKGEGTEADTEYSGENLKTFITQDPAGNTTIDVKMNKNLKVETIVATGKDGKDGKIGINGKDGVTTDISVTRDGKPGVDGAPGTTTTRIVYEKPDGTKEEVATLNDGMKYGGDTGNVIKKKLNEQVNVIGGITDTSKLTDDDNLGVVSDGNDNLKVRLAKALKGLESVTTGDTVINNTGLTVGGKTYVTNNGLNANNQVITNVADGVNGTDAVNVDQLKKAAAGATTKVADGKNTTVTSEDNADGSKTYHVNLNDNITLGTDPTKQVSIDGTTGNIDAGKVKINGKDGTVNGLTNKTWDPNNITSGQAATEDQLKAVDQKITNTSEELTKKGMDFAGNEGEFHRNLGEKVTIKGEGTKAASEYSGENIKTFADANGNVVVKMDKNLKTETIVVTGKDGKDGKIGINGKDGVTTNISVTRDGKPGVDGAAGTTTTRIVYEKPDGTKEEVATLNDGMKYGGDTGTVIKKKLNEQVNVIGGITDTSKLTDDDNLGVVSDGGNNLKVRMAKDLKGLNSVTTNTLTVGDVKIDNSGINAGNKKIANVAAGDVSSTSTDAVNGAQLWNTNQSIRTIGGAVNELGDRMNRVGAGAAALAALHPLDFDPDDKWDVAAGYGNYKDASAVAIGAFYRPNEDTMFSVGGSFGGGENMVNAGVSLKLGQGNHVSTSRVALAKEVEDLKVIVKAQSAEIKAMRGAMQAGMTEMKDVTFPDVPQDHWAYGYVKSLADRGLLVGYPDGEFKGERSMTRYEFAAIIYRALQNGAPIDNNMAKAIGEFEPEINRIKDLDRTRVDRISGKDNDRHKVERLRVNNKSNKEKGDYRDIYGSHISPEA